MSDIDRLKEKIRIAEIKVKEAKYAADQDQLQKREAELGKLKSQLPEPEAEEDSEECDSSTEGLTKIPDTEEPELHLPSSSIEASTEEPGARDETAE